MNLPSLLSSIMSGWRTGRTRLFIAVLVLLLAAHTKASADTLSEAGYKSLLPEAVVAGFQETVTEESAGATSTTSISSSVITISAETAPAESPSLEADAPKRKPDWGGIWFDTGVLAGAQVVAAGVLFLTPESVSNWSNDDKKSTFRKYNNNFANPHFDNDKLYINYVLHPYWGATYYTRGRERGLDQTSSFIFSALISAMYEFGIECIFEKPSIQDLIVTPVVGSLIGAFIFEPWRESIKRKEELRWYDHAALIFTDPIGVLGLGVEKMFGLKPTISVEYPVPKSTTRSSAPVIASNNNRIGLVMKFSLD